MLDQSIEDTVSRFEVDKLTIQEQRDIKRGLCPMCGSSLQDATLYPNPFNGDKCSGCFAEYVGALTIDD